MHRAAARLRAIIQCLQRGGVCIGVGAPRHRLTLPIRTQVLPLKITQFVMRLEILSFEARSPLQPYDAHPPFAEFGRKNAAGATHADDDDIGLFRGHLTSFARALWLALVAPSWARG